MSDSELLLKAIVLGVARWRPFRSRPDECGEVGIGGIHHATQVVGGVPQLTDSTRVALEEALAARRAG